MRWNGDVDFRIAKYFLLTATAAWLGKESQFFEPCLLSATVAFSSIREPDIKNIRFIRSFPGITWLQCFKPFHGKEQSQERALKTDQIDVQV